MQMQLVASQKLQRKLSMSAQMKVSVSVDKQGRLGNHRNSSHNGNTLEFETVFDHQTGELTEIYCESVLQHRGKAMLHVGVCMDHEQIGEVCRAMLMESGKNVQGLKKSIERKFSKNNVFFVPGWLHELDGCTINYWFLDSKAANCISPAQSKPKWMQLFFTFPQAVLMRQETLEYCSGMDQSLPSQLKYKQHYFVVSQTMALSFGQNRPEKVQYMSHFDIPQFKRQLFLVMKRNSIRCFSETLKINLYILSQASKSATHRQSKQTRHKYHNIANKYLKQEQMRYSRCLAELLEGSIKNQKQFEVQVQRLYQKFIKEIRQNIKMLAIHEEEKRLIQDAEVSLNASNQQILEAHKQKAREYNNKIIKQLFDQLLSQMGKNSYRLRNDTYEKISQKNRHKKKDGAQVLSQDVYSMMQEYEKRSVKSVTNFWVFNTFIRDNKNKYYQKLHNLEQQLEAGKKLQALEQLNDRIQIKKRVLQALDTEIRQLELKKTEVQQLNENLKKRQEEYARRMYQNDMDDGAEANTIKTISIPKNLVKSPRTDGLTTPKTQGRHQHNMFKGAKHEKSRPRKFLCCDCTIF